MDDIEELDVPKAELESLPEGVNKSTLIEIYQNLECPVCRNYMPPPIPQCVNRHSICKNCFQRVHICPICRGQKSIHARNFVLGHIYNALTIPCRYRDSGCEFSCIGKFLSKHELWCKYGQRICPVSNTRECGWHGELQHVRAHMASSHRENFFENRKRETFAITGLRRNRRFSYFTIIFYVYDNYFRLTWCIDRTGSTKWAVYLMGPHEEAGQFGYEIMFHKKIPTAFSKVIVWRSPCYSAPKDDSYVASNKCFHASVSVLDSYCKSGGELSFTVTIFKDPTRKAPREYRTIFGYKADEFDEDST